MINEELKGYDGFIDQDGKFYKVKKTCENRVEGHFEWADKYIKDYIFREFDVNKLYKLKECKTKDTVEILINYFGFVYYSHDSEYYKPIVKGPNPRLGGFKASKEQLDTLMHVMLLNGEDPFENSLLFNERDTLFIDKTIG